MSPHEPTSGPPSTHPDRSERRLGLSFHQLAASALAAASAAFGASYLGVAGTIIGAAVASVIATVASAMYASSLRRSTEAVRRTATQWTRTAAIAPVVDPNAPRPEAADDTRELVLAPEPTTPRRPVPWARVSVAAAAVLAVTLGVLTGVEGILGRPLANVVGGSDATGTSLGSVDGSGGWSKSTIPETVNPPATPAPTPTPTPTSTSEATPTEAPTTEPSDPATAPTTSPTTQPTTEPTETDQP